MFQGKYIDPTDICNRLSTVSVIAVIPGVCEFDVFPWALTNLFGSEKDIDFWSFAPRLRLCLFGFCYPERLVLPRL